ncbi:aspartyl/asparaginyl beta-hydroxylase domain-containing protein [Sphingobium subterraneum]|uniref:Aspartyl/asparaginyl beta-hydroxylase (Cupin superfamily) n=1 Tax=Sphingobium subterraneum TaxID=627688 RepID=A0A841IYA1_9SPHN|nr:aspartyl/asparaginyl beta-hydroxylase domain-containing protein [Sphingobium subterraneum]MBB6123384.1 aspartyl/asparaginyl beta-hydroxylase (cupin superfamily) [Sphingobium subterraneum]
MTDVAEPMSETAADRLIHAARGNPTAAVDPTRLKELEEALFAAAKASGSGTPGERRRSEAFVERLVGKRQVFHQQPREVHYPGLPDIEFFDREDFDWLGEVEAAHGDIRDEFLAILNETVKDVPDLPQGTPLQQWSHLNRSQLFGAFHLLLNGEVTETAARAPKTMALLDRLPQPRIAGRSPMAAFFVLQPKMPRIPSHCGPVNIHVLLHLPLISQEGCGIRVGAESREWRTGEPFVFDETIDHEAWNESDEPCAILICDIWNPRLSENERRTIADLMAVMKRFA